MGGDLSKHYIVTPTTERSEPNLGFFVSSDTLGSFALWPFGVLTTLQETICSFSPKPTTPALCVPGHQVLLGVHGLGQDRPLVED